MAAPTPRPVIPASEIGESITRSTPNSLDEAREHLERRARLGDVLADHEDGRIALHLLGDRLSRRHLRM